MLERWKHILTNWNNCHFSENAKDEPKIYIDSLINIISHLRQNYNLDESKSSLLQAHTVKEFLIEKYPGFEFENGTKEPKTGDDIYMVASLLLFFVCVNSKDVDIKNAMCSKLCSKDQETILKFSKSLLQCSSISYKDVQAAITEACGQDIAAMEAPLRNPVVETPPALRSLHSEVRRLQAALDAERFDRNYLQEELGRTNAKVDKLLKEKEQHKLDIVNLKAKISLCSDESDTTASVGDDRTAKLMKQLDELEGRLVETQGQLDDVVYYRDTYKAKVEELKQERDKWLSLHQDELTRASTLFEELETERRLSQTLQELLTELRQHNKLNGLDSSSLECDDADTSRMSLPHNASVCSEVCANIVEVQLGEERAKIVVLKQQIQTLQDQMNDVIKKAEAEKLALEDMVSEKDHNIFNLKHRINEEIEDKNNLKSHYDNEITKLNNEINELEQTVKDNSSHSRSVLERKMMEIQTLQEEKLSLLQSFDSEKTKLEKIVSDLKAEIETEKQSKSHMKDSYENHLMKLNEKVLKRNNEIMEFQNNICEKSEMIESLQLLLKKEKEAGHTLGDYCNSLNDQKFALENDLKQYSQKINELQTNLQIRNSTIEDLNKELSHLKAAVKARDGKIEDVLKDIEQIKEESCKEREKLLLDLDERKETIHSLQVQLKNEIDFKMELQNELSQLHNIKKTLTEDLESRVKEINKLKADTVNNHKTIDALNLYIKEEKKSNQLANETIKKLKDAIVAKENEIERLNSHAESIDITLQEEIMKKHHVESELGCLHEEVKFLCNEKSQMEKEITAKSEYILNMTQSIEILTHKLENKDAMLHAFELDLSEECKKYDEFELKAVSELEKLTDKINESNKIAGQLADVWRRNITENDHRNNTLSMEVERLKEDLQKAQMETIAITEKLAQEENYKHILEANQQIQFGKIENLTEQFNCEIESRSSEIETLKSEIESLTRSVEEKSESLEVLQEQVKEDIEAKTKMHMEMTELQTKIVNLKASNKEMEQELGKEIDARALVIKALKNENELLLNSIKQDTNTHEILVKEKDQLIEKLEQTIKDNAVKLDNVNQYSENLKKSWEELKTNTTAVLIAKDNEIMTLNNDILILKDMHTNLINEKDIYIFQLQENVKQEIAKCKSLHDYSENLVRSWEDYKHGNKITLDEREEETVELKCNISLLEQSILELNQNNQDLNSKILKLENSKMELENKLTEATVAKSALKMKMEEIIKENEIIISDKEQFEAEVEKLSQDIQVAQEKNNSLASENVKIKDNIAETSDIINTLLQDKDTLKEQLAAEKCLKEIAEKKSSTLHEHNETFKARIMEITTVESELCQEVESLKHQVKDLQITLKKEKKAIGILEELKDTISQELDQAQTSNINLVQENQLLIIEKDNVSKQVEEISTAQASLIDIKDLLNAEKETLIRSLDIQKNKIIVLENENTVMKARIDELDAEISDLQHTRKELHEELSRKQVAEEEIANQFKESIKKAAQFIQENGDISKNVAHLINDDGKTVKTGSSKIESMNRLNHEAKVLMNQNDKLIAILSIEKSARDEVETDKNNLEQKFKDLQSQFEDMTETINDLKDNYNKTVEELGNKEKEIKLLRMEHQSVKDDTSLVSTTISDGLDNLLTKFRNENFNNPVLKKLIEVDYQDSKLNERCNLVINIANALTSEIENLKNLETSLKNENLALVEMQEALKQKEMEIFDLNSEVNKLRQSLHENKMELTKKTESYSQSMDSKIKDIHTLQNENQSLHNDLSEVKLQLEVKVHSLKEKLIDNENLTDKLKKTYESQIENLNVMITKLSNYLKDKTLEMDALRKEKEQLNETIKENRKAIKSLEDEVKSEKQNMDKIITDFDAERQVLKNMVTVTEAVMEDQKNSLNNVILEHIKAKDTLQNQVDELTDVVKNTVKKHQSYDEAFTSIVSLLRRERVEKDLVEKESEDLREFLDDLIIELNKERNRHLSVVSYLETQNQELIEDVEKYKNDIDTLVKSNDKMKMIEDALEIEFKSKTDELTKVLQKTSDEKKTLEEQIKNLTETQTETNKRLLHMNEIVKEKENAELKAIEAVTKLDALKECYDSNEVQKIEEVAKLKCENQELVQTLAKVLHETSDEKKTLEEKIKNLTETQTDINNRLLQINEVVKEKEIAELKTIEVMAKLEALKENINSSEVQKVEEVTKLRKKNQELVQTLEENRTAILKLEQSTNHELEQNRKLREDYNVEKQILANKCSTLQDYQEKAAILLEERQKEIVSLQKELESIQAKVVFCEDESKAKDGLISQMSKEKDAIINTISKELAEEKITREKCEKELENQKTVVYELKNNVDIKALKKENEQLIRAIGQQETFAAMCHKVAGDNKHQEHRDIYQVDNTSSDNTQSSMESQKTITDLEKIIHDKNRAITSLQQDVTYLKSMMAESETKLLDVNQELELSKENCEQLSGQLKKIVYQKNEEIAELKKQVSKMSVTENRASQIIKVSAKYQAIILRRIAEIKSNTILKELTNFGNTNSDNDLRRGLTAGTVTMEDLENFLETTDRHLKRCSEKQVFLTKERDRLTEVNRINESEIVNLKKFLTELSISFQTFTSVKDMYAQKLSRVISVQRTVRREILNLDSRITDATMCKLERGYAAVMQDLAECAMNLERWVERCLSRTVSVEKIKQAFISDNERTSLASPSFQHTGLEVQLDELDKSFQKLLEEVARAQKGDGAKDAQATTVMEVRAEYEDKLNRMKSKMKELFNEQMAVFKEKQREEMALLERELQKTRDKMAESKAEYEKYIRQLTKELWSVGEKYLVKNDEAEWLRKKQRSGSLMSLQHVHSSGLIQPVEAPSRPSDASSLRSLPCNNANKREGRQMHMSDEEGEVFDNRWLKELSTPRREPPPGLRLSELKWRNSLCPPHLKSSYPAETQFASVLDEEELKAGAPPKPQRKEVGITAYKKPGPPTPSKQAGRLSATGSELREAMRAEPEPHADRKASTPARIRNFLRFNKNDTGESTPRARKLSSIFRKNR